MSATFIPYGATCTHLVVPDKHGAKRDIILGWDDAINYCAVTGRTQAAAAAEHTYFGATIGRIANRIEKGTFSVAGKTYHTPLNDHGYDTLHGGWVTRQPLATSLINRGAYR